MTGGENCSIGEAYMPLKFLYGKFSAFLQPSVHSINLLFSALGLLGILSPHVKNVPLICHKFQIFKNLVPVDSIEFIDSLQHEFDLLALLSSLGHKNKQVSHACYFLKNGNGSQVLVVFKQPYLETGDIYQKTVGNVVGSK